MNTASPTIRWQIIRPSPTWIVSAFACSQITSSNNNFFAGAAVQTAFAADSGNTTFSEGFDNYSLYLWRFFVGWHSKDDSLKFIVGKQPNPFYEETELLWDADISPAGITEQVKI